MNIHPTWLRLAPVAAAMAAVAAMAVWLHSAAPAPSKRVPVAHPTPAVRKGPVRGGAGAQEGLRDGGGVASKHPGDWPQFRGPKGDNVALNANPIPRSWPAGGPRVLWRVPVGEGHAGAAIHKGSIYLIDYDREKQMDAIRRLSLEDGAEIWRYAYPVEIKRNHGMSRTIPAVDDRFVLTLGPKCHVYCLDAESGALLWKKDLVAEHGSVVPPWYAGQCPILDNGRAILAPGAKPLMMAVDAATGQTVWETKEFEDAGMTHASIATIEFGGVRQYLYAATQGLISVAADDGRVLWNKPDWRIKIANIPTPIPIGDGRIFLVGGYDAGCAMIRLEGGNGKAITHLELFRLKQKDFGSHQQTPVLYEGYIYGVATTGELVCLDLEGKRRWTSGAVRFGLGPYLIVDGVILALEDQSGILRMVEATPKAYTELASAKLLNGHDAWAPMAVAEGWLVLRDLTEMICVDLR